MKLLGLILSVLVKGLEAWNTHRASKLAKAELKEKEHENTIKALEARDAVDPTDDKLLLPPDQR